MLGLDVLEIGNEGKFVAAVVSNKAEAVLAALRATKLGRDAAIIGEATSDFDLVAMETVVGVEGLSRPRLGTLCPESVRRGIASMRVSCGPPRSYKFPRPKPSSGLGRGGGAGFHV